MKISDFEYQLPQRLIAQHPAEHRRDARLMVIHRDSGTIEHRRFSDFLEFLNASDLMVFNDTKVIPARFFGKKRTGGRVEIMLERVTGARSAVAQIRASKMPKAGSEIVLNDGEIVLRLKERRGRFFVLDFPEPGVTAIAAVYGQVPLPPYIRRHPEKIDLTRYQTVYAEQGGAVAAPTAGLHFDEEMLEAIDKMGITREMVTLHVGAGTFQPVQVDDIREHRMHKEWFSLSGPAAKRILFQKQRKQRVLAVGTTSLRAVESAALGGEVRAGQGETEIFIYPGYEFRVIDALLTNFHLPGSTLLMLVSALMGQALMKEAYRAAIEREYRFFSYGDAMLIL